MPVPLMVPELLRCISIMDAQLLSAIIALFDILMHADIFFISACVMFIMSGCIFIVSEQPLLFIISVFDMRLHAIIMSMSAADIFMPPIAEWFIESCPCALTGAAALKASMAEARKIVVGFMTALRKCSVIILMTTSAFVAVTRG